jgi:RNA polymerase sigma factor (TIGR02999 family)
MSDDSIEQEAGQSTGPTEILTLLYDELRRLASAKMASFPTGYTLQPTALVHEAWLRLGTGERQVWQSRRHFYAAAAQAMRHILIERARCKRAVRHGGELARVDLDQVEIAAPADDGRLFEINDALEELGLTSPDKAEIVKLRFFAGLEIAEIADLLQVSPRTVIRSWNYAKAWLADYISSRSRKSL